MIEIAHQGRAGLTAGDVTGGTAHVDIDNVGALGLGDPGPLRHPTRLAASELDHMRPYAGRFAAQSRHAVAFGQFIAGSHFRYDETRSQLGGELANG
ncbi:hypothetical protein ACVWYJ_002417 [Bradyrhizobium sp. USDA 4471]